MSSFSYPLLVFCPICKTEMDFNYARGRDCRCCSKQCLQEFNWRYALLLTNTPYYPDPKGETSDE